jgi:hypothetical protein
MPNAHRRAQLLRFKELMKGFIAELRATPSDSNLWGFSGWMMRDMNALAATLGWLPATIDALQLPFWRRGDFGLTIFDAGGGSWTGAVIVPEPSEEQRRDWGAKLEDNCWVYPDVASSELLRKYLAAVRSDTIARLLPMLRSWIVKADAELASEDLVQVPAMTADSATRGSPARTRLTKDEANIEARKYLKKKPLATARELSEGIGCALGRVPKLPAWQSVQEQRAKGRKPKQPAVVRLSDKMQRVTGAEDEQLKELIEEQKADNEPSPLEDDLSNRDEGAPRKVKVYRKQ